MKEYDLQPVVDVLEDAIKKLKATMHNENPDLIRHLRSRECPYWKMFANGCADCFFKRAYQIEELK